MFYIPDWMLNLSKKAQTRSEQTPYEIVLTKPDWFDEWERLAQRDYHTQRPTPIFTYAQ